MKIKFISILLIALLFSCFTASAQSWLWGEQGGSGGLKGDASPSDVATNKTGNVYQTGSFGPSILSFGTSILTTSSFVCAAYLVKYDSTGNLLWARQSISNNSNSSVGYSVTTDDSDNSYITGLAFNVDRQQDTAIFGPDTLYSPAGGGELFLVKYNANGKVMWARQPSYNISPGNGWGVATDNFGHEYVTGFFAILIKYDRNGNIIWAIPPTYNKDTFDDIGYSVATDNSGNVYMAGIFDDSLTFGTYRLYSGNGGIFIAKFDSNGNALWAQQSNNKSFYSNSNKVSIATDRSGSVYLTGSFLDSIDFGSYAFTTSLNSYGSFFVVKYTPDGNIVWGKEPIPLNFNLEVGWGCYSACTDNFNNIYISGGEEYGSSSQQTSFIFANDTLSFTDTDSHDPPSFLLKIDEFGDVICGSTLPTGGFEYNAVASNPASKFVYIGGEFLNSLVLGKDTLIDNTGGDDPYIGRWKPCNGCDLAVNSPSHSLSVCDGQSVKLSASGGTNYYWSPVTGLNEPTGDTVVASPTASVIYSVFVTDSVGCNGQTSDTVTVIPSPNKPTFTQHNDTLISSSLYDNQWYRGDTLLKNDTSQYLIINTTGNYYVEVNNEANGCSTSSDTTIITSLTGINQLSVNNNQFSIYPNPTNGEINISSSKTIDYLKITDLLGQLILQSQPQETQFTFTINATGMYFVTLTSDNETVTKKVVVVK